MAARYASPFPTLQLSSIADFGGWSAVQARHFANGAVFDQIYRPGAATAAQLSRGADFLPVEAAGPGLGSLSRRRP